MDDWWDMTVTSPLPAGQNAGDGLLDSDLFTPGEIPVPTSNAVEQVIVMGDAPGDSGDGGGWGYWGSGGGGTGDPFNDSGGGGGGSSGGSDQEESTSTFNPHTFVVDIGPDDPKTVTELVNLTTQITQKAYARIGGGGLQKMVEDAAALVLGGNITEPTAIRFKNVANGVWTTTAADGTILRLRDFSSPGSGNIPTMEFKISGQVFKIRY